MTPLPPPPEFGLPPAFPQWRGKQAEAVVRILSEDGKRFHPACMPTGFGKTLVGLGCAAISGKRTAYLTSTRGLQDQISRDFGRGVADIRGMGNYECLERAGTGCDTGRCRDRLPCSLKLGGCLYFDSHRRALDARVVLTNYSYWLAIHEYGGGLGQFDALVLDEAHEAPEELSRFLRVEIGDRELRTLLSTSWPGGGVRARMQTWREWAREQIHALREEYFAKGGGGGYEDVDPADESGGIALIRSLAPSLARGIRQLVTRLKRLESAEDSWVVERGERGYSWEPIWPAPYAEALLFRGIPSVIVSSATLRPKTLELLGVPGGGYSFQEYASGFPLFRRPVIHAATDPPTRVDSRITELDRKRWLRKIDRLLEARSARKGVIHTVSYERARYLAATSVHRSRFVLHSSARDLAAAVAKFKAAAPASGAVLVSPSVGTGFDFPGDECRFQIVAKLPFPDSRSPLAAARVRADPEWPMFEAMTAFVQITGRGVRGPEDWCETLVADDHFGWWWWKYRGFAPKWLQDAIRTSRGTLPPPLEIT